MIIQPSTLYDFLVAQEHKLGTVQPWLHFLFSTIRALLRQATMYVMM